MAEQHFPVIDPVATGQNIIRLRTQRGLSVGDLQRWFNFAEPRAIYKWQSGKTLPSVDNLYALSALLGVSMNEILVPFHCVAFPGPQSCGPDLFFLGEDIACKMTNYQCMHHYRKTDMPLAPRQVGGVDNGYVYSEPLIRCVLAGHIHFNYESLLPVILRKGGISVFSDIGSV